MDLRELPDLGGGGLVDGELFDEFVDGVVVYERDGTIVYANPASCRTAGRVARDLLGRRVWDIVPEAEHEAFGEAFRRVIETGSYEHLDQYHPRVGRWFSTRFYPAKGHVFVFSRDVTEERFATARLAILANASRIFAEAAGDEATGFETIARHVAEVLHDLCSLRLVSDDRAYFEPPIAIWDDDPSVRELLREIAPARANEVIGQQVIAAMRPVVLTGLAPEVMAERIAPAAERPRVARLGIHSVILAPLRAHGQTLGVITVCRRLAGTTAPFEEADVKLLEELADRIALVVAQRRATADLRRWYNAFVNASWGITLARPDNRFIAVNRAFAAMHGTTPEAWTGRSLLDMFAPHSRAAFAPLVQRAHATGHASYESEHARADGSVFPVLSEVTAVKDVSGRVKYRVANFHDITERKRIEHALVDERVRFEKVLERAPFAVVVYEGPEHRVVLSNPKHDEMTGGRLAVGKPLLESLPELRGQEILERLDAVFRDGRVITAHEMPAKLVRDGALVDCWFDVTWQPMFDVAGVVSGVVVSAIEVSAHVRAREPLRRV